jgi:hypothetical protein
VVASLRLRDFGSRDSLSEGSGRPPNSQLSLRGNRRGIAIRSFVKRPGRHLGRGICVIRSRLRFF